MIINQIKNYILKNLYTGSIKTISSFVLSFIVLPLTIKNIGIEKYGIISVVLMFSSFTGIFDLGFSKTLVYLHGDKTANEKRIYAVYYLNHCMFILIILTGIVFYIFRINLFGNTFVSDIKTLRMINLASILILGFEIINNLLRSSLEAELKLSLVNWGFLIQSSVIYLGWYLLSIVNANIILFLGIPLVASFFSILYYKINLSSGFSGSIRPDGTSIKYVFKTSFQFLKVGALNSFHLPLIKYVLVIASGDPKVIGIFDLSTKLALFPVSIMSYISVPFFSLASKVKYSDQKRLWNIVRRTSFILALVSFLGYSIFLIINEPLIIYFFKEYSDLIFNTLNMLLLGYLSIAITESVQRYYLGTGKINLVAQVKLISILTNLILIAIILIRNLFSLNNLTLIYCISLFLTSSYWFIKLFTVKNFD